MKKKNSNEDKLPPYSEKAEQGVLSCCLQKPLDCLNACEERGSVREWFYDLRHQLIFDGMQGMQREGRAIDLITLQQRLKDAGNLEECGGIAYLSVLMDAAPSAANLSYYADIVQEKWMLRRLLHTCVGAAARIHEFEGDARGLVESVTHDLLLLGEKTTQAQEVSLRTAVLEVMPEIEDYHRGGAQGSGLRTGLSYLDKMLGGFGGDAGNYFVLGGRPGTGKTALLVQVLLYLTRRYAWKTPGEVPTGGEERLGVPVYLFSMEMKRKALAKRMIFQEARMNSQKWRSGFADSEDVPKVITAAQSLTRVKNFYLDDTKRLTIEGLCARARRAHRQYGIKCFGLDYLQLLKMQRRQGRPDRVQEMGEISNELMALSGELNVPFMVLAQMNRDWEKESHRKPRMSDLKDCGDIEQDADFVGLMYQPKFTADEKREFTELTQKVYGTDWAHKPRRVNLLLEKNRNGMTGDTEHLFEPWCTRFEDWGEWLRSNQGQENLTARQMQRDGGPEDRDERLPSNEEMDI